ncbi:MAG: hypothetical protein COA69_00035 [Robiginitomaculum sp.]|nr:MAG: hypothetical protein COA69_00035 [Robiginitomaculum sp.]
MVAINFSVFLDKVETREKRMTIRRTTRGKVGDKLQLYTGMRTKKCRKLVDEDATLQEIAPVKIDETSTQIYRNLFGVVQWAHIDPEDFAQKDGFDCFEDMKTFFRKQYGLPFVGVAHSWHWPDIGIDVEGKA